MGAAILAGGNIASALLWVRCEGNFLGNRFAMFGDGDDVESARFANVAMATE